MTTGVFLQLTGICLLLWGLWTPNGGSFEINDVGVQYKNSGGVKLHFSWAELIEEARKRGKIP